LSVSAYIIAGGKSSRMGFDKRKIKIKNSTFIETTIQKAAAVTNHDVTLVGNNLDEFQNFRVISDYEKDKGPLSGIIAALSDSKSDWILALAADVPLLNETDLSKLIDAIDPNYEMIGYKSSKGIEPLIAIYSSKLKDLFIDQFDKGELSIQRIMKKINHKLISPDKENSLFNVNDQNDLHRLKNQGNV